MAHWRMVGMYGMWEEVSSSLLSTLSTIYVEQMASNTATATLLTPATWPLHESIRRLSLRIGEISGARAFTLYHTTTWKAVIKRAINESREKMPSATPKCR
ncbi:MAG: hypothetical protein M3297_15370 [Thermoproteota archaeon]|nr:hypothetical protein [Thermoproteota archaeon]